MELYKKYRPKKFKDVIGNTPVIGSLHSIMQREEPPHAYLFTGPSGVGKTTLARIVAKKLGCARSGISELNTANYRGIDHVRELIQQTALMPLQGTRRAWILDECFAANTLINTPIGTKAIQELKIGDSVFSIAGKTKIEKIFTNKISLDRIIKINFYDHPSIYTTKQHLFLTATGWKEAQYLTKKDFTLSFNSNIMNNIILLKGDNNELFKLWKKNIRKAKILLKELFKSNYRKKTKKNTKTQYKMSLLWKAVLRLASKILFPFVFTKRQAIASRNKRKNIQQENAKKNLNVPFTIQQNQERESTNKIIFSKNESQQPISQSQNNRENESNKKIKWNFKHLAGRTWRKWKIYFSPIIPSICFGMADGTTYSDGSQFLRQIRVSLQLQSGYRKQKIKNSNRSRWQRAQYEKSYIERFKKDKKTDFVRVENIEVYQSGNNDRSFQDVVGDKERNQECVNFYDLQIVKHPSYFANGCAVHNCHQISRDGQEALLKILEDTPPHVYFLLATTNPEKLKSTIRNRCSCFDLQSIPEEIIGHLIRKVVAQEEKEIPKSVRLQIQRDCLGSARAALVMLDQILDLPKSKMSLAARRAGEQEQEAISLCRALVKKLQWKEVATILKGLTDQDPERLRLAVLGYCKSILLNGKHDHAFFIMESFKDPFYNTGHAGLVKSCYEIINGGE